ncbi:MAG: bifunctional glutamate N-acetyltransferase/amino-acid acetyltransferase ArgJ [Pseudomonadales bacterium]|nr:bifunctional glutamate N-acetyltransferase/amino-acid acetyltransferase ArgJ [Pseudomonadales bacterium]
MSVNLNAAQDLLAVSGIRLGATAARIKYAERQDLAIIVSGQKTRVAGIFTQNSFAAAPVQVCRAHLKTSASQEWALLINSGNANAATGDSGFGDAIDSCRHVSEKLGLSYEQVLPFSTGVIGERLPMQRLKDGCDVALTHLSEDNWLDVAGAIMTTDTVPKGASRRFELGGCEVTITGIAKGSGMIRPDMATMLSFVATDAVISQQCLDQLLVDAANLSFNRITVDGDTSTNDSLVFMASCEAGNSQLDDPSHKDYQIFKQELDALFLTLAQSLVRDAEGATRFVSLTVSGGRNREECLAVAYTIAESPLVKTALFAGDPNWGRFCMAIGRSGIKELDVSRISLFLDDVCIAQGGELDGQYEEANAAQVMQKKEYGIFVDLGRGAVTETIWTSDLSYEYIKINAEYRT